MTCRFWLTEKVPFGVAAAEMEAIPAPVSDFGKIVVTLTSKDFGDDAKSELPDSE